MRVDVTEGRAAARRLVTLVRGFIDGQPVDDCRQLSAALGSALRIALRLPGLVQRIWPGRVDAPVDYSRSARHINTYDAICRICRLRRDNRNRFWNFDRLHMRSCDKPPEKGAVH